MRALLEGGAARMAAQHATPSEIETLRYLLQEFQKAGDSPERNAELNRQFHAAIYDAAHNRHLMTALGDLTDALALLRSTTFAAPGRPKVALREHRAIVAAIAAKQPVEAEQAAREHIRAAQQIRINMMIGDRRD
jgi:DNA-binding FadR family transcriptional regulator